MNFVFVLFEYRHFGNICSRVIGCYELEFKKPTDKSETEICIKVNNSLNNIDFQIFITWKEDEN